MCCLELINVSSTVLVLYNTEEVVVTFELDEVSICTLILFRSILNPASFDTPQIHPIEPQDLIPTAKC